MRRRTVHPSLFLHGADTWVVLDDSLAVTSSERLAALVLDFIAGLFDHPLPISVVAIVLFSLGCLLIGTSG